MKTLQKLKLICSICDYVYDEDTPFEELLETYVSPVCGIQRTCLN